MSLVRKFLGFADKPKGLTTESGRSDSQKKKAKKRGDLDQMEVMRIGGQVGPNILSKKVESEVRAENDQEVFQYDMPKAEMGFGDLLKEHQPGERVPGVAVTKKSSQSRGAVMRDLEQLQPDIERKPIKLPKKFVIQLKQQEEKICLDQIFTRTNPKFPYILIKRIRFILTPLSSFFDDFTNVNAMILDTRIINRPKRQTAKLNSNVDYRGSISLDYCFPISSLSKFFLYMQLEVSLMEQGEEWATVMMKVEAEEMDFPVMEDYQQVSIVAQLPPSGLERYKFDPTHMDLTIRDVHRQKLLDLYESGDIADTTKPILNKTSKAKYTATTVQKQHGALISSGGSVDWSGVRTVGRQEIDEISVEPSMDGFQEPSTSLVDALTEQALNEQRAMSNPNPQRIVEVDEESLTEMEKEALRNMESNRQLLATEQVEKTLDQEEIPKKKKVGFPVDGVRV